MVLVIFVSGCIFPHHVISIRWKLYIPVKPSSFRHMVMIFSVSFKYKKKTFSGKMRLQFTPSLRQSVLFVIFSSCVYRYKAVLQELFNYFHMKIYMKVCISNCVGCYYRQPSLWIQILMVHPQLRRKFIVVFGFDLGFFLA